MQATYCEWQSFGQWSEGGHLAELSRAPATLSCGPEVGCECPFVTAAGGDLTTQMMVMMVM